MKDCDSIGRSNKKANGRSATTKFAASKLGPKSSDRNKRAEKTKAIMGASSSKSRSKTKSSGGTVGSSRGAGARKKGQKQSPDQPRPRRRASQTYFFKYQLAKNPLKAEEEDLKLALLASLQQCADKASDANNNIDSNNHQKSVKDSSSNHQANNNSNRISHYPDGTVSTTNGNGSSNHHHHHHNHNNHHTNSDKTNSTTKTKFNASFHQSKETPQDEDILKKYKPETEDFLTFICFRTSIATNRINLEKQSPNADSPNQNNDNNNLKQACNNSSMNKLTNINNSPTNNNNSNNNDSLGPNNHRRPIRQSPRLASSNRKISENDSTSNTAYDNPITYEEDMKRASIALEDMAQEINSSDGINNEIAQNLPFKNSKHLVKGLMTREFAGAFADEQTIFESISNHKL